MMLACAMHGSVLHGSVLHGSALHGSVLHGSALHGSALPASVLGSASTKHNPPKPSVAGQVRVMSMRGQAYLVLYTDVPITPLARGLSA
ncbi:hypothetical protein [Paenibacillus sp. FSL R5-0810]|uniref:hypothetical protein n=1 Tax=Paenibacillus sp. FSL R5-0810 TaxID=2921659 RepID=UPI0030F62AF5